MNTRPLLNELSPRLLKPLHRTLPFWTRKVREDGHVEWAVYVPHRLGGAVFVTERFSTDTPRATVASVLRERRRMLWGRSRHEADEPAPAPRKAAKKATAPDPQPEPVSPAEVTTVVELVIEQAGMAARGPAPDLDALPWHENEHLQTLPEPAACATLRPDEAQLGFSF